MLCGCSLGFTIICLYLENYGTARIAGVSFVDQSAAMYHRPGWVTGAPHLSDPAMCAGTNHPSLQLSHALAGLVDNNGIGVQTLGPR